MRKDSGTKEKIEQIALELFAKHGYNSVSIRDICKQLGFTESSIYYHFKNKQAIMDSLLQKVEFMIEEKQARFDERFQKTMNVTEEEMIQVTVGFFMLYFLNPFIFKMISVLTMERMSEQHAYEIYHRIVFDLPLMQQEKVFGQMMERGFIKESNPRILAEQYLAIIYFAFQRHCIGKEPDEQTKEVVTEEITSNIRDLYSKIQV